jgi:hypothetical protein
VCVRLCTSALGVKCVRMCIIPTPTPTCMDIFFHFGNEQGARALATYMHNFTFYEQGARALAVMARASLLLRLR